jgi:hypothetical protein
MLLLPLLRFLNYRIITWMKSERCRSQKSYKLSLPILRYVKQCLYFEKRAYDNEQQEPQNKPPFKRMTLAEWLEFEKILYNQIREDNNKPDEEDKRPLEDPDFADCPF